MKLAQGVWILKAGTWSERTGVVTTPSLHHLKLSERLWNNDQFALIVNISIEIF